MTHSLSIEDHQFKSQVESCEFPVAEFNHRAHIRLAYAYLSESNPETSVDHMRTTLLNLLNHAGINPSEKYHETLTQAWIYAVNHFMNMSNESRSADDFIDSNPIILDSNIMMTHYSTQVLFSDQARNTFIEPNLDPIPRY